MYTRAYDPAYPSGTEDADTIDTIIQNVQNIFSERLMDLFGITDFTTDPLKPISIHLGANGTGLGGYNKFIDDTGTYRWFTGIGSGAGNKNFVIFDNVNSVSRLVIDATTGAISGNMPVTNLSGTTLPNTIISSSLTAVGTITSGTWHGSAITDTYLASIAGSKVSGNVAGADLATNSNSLGGIAASNFARRDVANTFASLVTLGAGISGNGGGLTNLTGSNVVGAVANATIAAGCSGNANTATNAANLGGLPASAFALLSGATFTGDVHAPHYYIG